MACYVVQFIQDVLAFLFVVYILVFYESVAWQ